MAVFQKLADASVGGNRYLNLNPLWDYCCAKHAGFADKVRALSPKATVPNTMVAALTNIRTEMNEAKKHKNKNKNKGRAASAPAPTERSTPKPKVERQPAEMECIGVEDLLWYETKNGDVEHAQLIDEEDFGPDMPAGKVSIMSANRIYKTMLTWQDTDPFANPAAACCKKIAYDDLLSKVNPKLLSRFPHTTCDLYFVGRNRAPVEIGMVMFQFGSEHIIYNDKTQKAEQVSATLAESTKVSVRIPNLEAASNFEKDVKDTFKKTACTAIGARLLYRDQLPFHTNTYHDMTWKGDTISKHVGMASINTKDIEEVLRRSGINGVFIYTLGNNEYAVIYLPKSMTLSEARDKCGLLGNKHFGLVLTPNCFAIRVNECDKVACEKILKPELAALIGDTLMGTKKSDCVLIEACGIPKDFDDCDIVQQTSMNHSGDQKWTCKPGRTLRGGAPGVKNVLVQAREMPPRRQVKVQAGGRWFMVVFREHELPKKSQSVWSKAAHSSEAQGSAPSAGSWGMRTDNSVVGTAQPSMSVGQAMNAGLIGGSSCAAPWATSRLTRSVSLGASAKAAPRSAKPTWADTSEAPADEDEDMQLTLELGRESERMRAKNEEQRQLHAFMDGEISQCPTPSTSPRVLPVVFTNAPIVEYPAPSAEAEKKNTPFLERLAAINRKNEETERLNKERHDSAANELAEFKCDMETQMTALGDGFSKLSDKFASFSSDVDARLAANAVVMGDMKQMLLQILATNNAPPAHPAQPSQQDAQWQDAQWNAHWYQDSHNRWNREENQHADGNQEEEDEFGSIGPDQTSADAEPAATSLYGVDIITSDHRGTPYGH